MAFFDKFIEHLVVSLHKYASQCWLFGEAHAFLFVNPIHNFCNCFKVKCIFISFSSETFFLYGAQMFNIIIILPSQLNHIPHVLSLDIEEIVGFDLVSM